MHNQHIEVTFTVSIPSEALQVLFMDCLKQALFSHATQAALLPSATPTPTLDKLLNTKDICALFDVSTVTVHNWKKQGKLPYKKQGRRVYFLESEIMALLQASGSGKGMKQRK